MEMNLWDCCVEEALAKLGLLQLLRSLRPITPSREKLNPVIDESPSQDDGELEVFDEMQPWDRASVEIEIADSTFQKWLLDIPSSGDEIVTKDGAIKSLVEHPNQFKKLILFSGNDYLGLSSHPTIGRAAAKAALEHRMGPRGSALICGYTFHHRLLESCLAELKKKEMIKY